MFKKLVAAFSILILPFATTASGQVKPADNATEAKAVDVVFSDLAKPGSPGCALAVSRDGKTLTRGNMQAENSSSPMLWPWTAANFCWPESRTA